MGKKILYMILGLIVAIIVIAECFSNTYVNDQPAQTEGKVTQKIDHLFNE